MISRATAQQRYWSVRSSKPSWFRNIKHHYQWFWISNITDFVWISRITRPFSETKKSVRLQKTPKNCLSSPPQRYFFWRNIFHSSQKYYKGPCPVQTELFREHFSSTLPGPNVHSNDPPFIALPRPALHWWPALLHFGQVLCKRFTELCSS